MTVVFWCSILLFVYIYAGYPLLLTVIAELKRKPVKRGSIEPTVSLIIAAYNEGGVIEDKIRNSLELDYPHNTLEIIVASDSSSDRTDAIAKRYRNHRVKLVRLAKRGGKTAVQNEAVRSASGDILVFSDATTIFLQDVIRKLVRNFSDRTVGCVGGEIIFRKRSTNLFSGEKNSSERYDDYIKSKECEIETTFGLTGCLYAVKKALYTPLKNDQTSDFVLPLKIIEKGYRVITEPEAIGYEEASSDSGNEFRRRIRTTRAGMKGLYEMGHLLSLSHGVFVPFGLTSHKILRWLSPFLMVIALSSNIFILHGSHFYLFTLFMQVMFYAAVGLGYVFEHTRIKPKLFTVPFNFTLVNLAAVCGLIEFLRGNNQEIWQTERG